MSRFSHPHELPKSQERTMLFVLGAIQFTHILDFMIMMPLGAQLMQAFAISPAKFSQLVASYGIAAAISGFAGGFILDRFDRKRALLVLYTGFGLATLACAFAPTFYLLLIARLAAGACGGLSSSLVTAMLGDFIPPARRGRAMAFVAAAFPVASILGVPLGLVLAGKLGWHAAFFFLAACAVVNGAIASLALPHLRTAVQNHEPWQQMKEIMSHRVHLRAFALGTMVGLSGGILVPFLAPSFIANLGLNEQSELPIVYIIGGLATAISTPIVGWLSDRMDRLRLLIYISAGAIVVTLIIMQLGPSSVSLASLMMALFMVSMSGRYAPAMTMITNAVEARYRGGFMSINSALQLAANAAASMLAGWFITRDSHGHFLGLPMLSYLATGFLILMVYCAMRLCAAAPHVAQHTRKDIAPPPPPPEISAA
ncbi:MAG: MFS transporter [Opitutaceae bacterium]|nr:MFS transporter [Opitutaceae bacterium]